MLGNDNNIQIHSNSGDGIVQIRSSTVGFPSIRTSTKLAIKDTLPSTQNYLVGLGTDIQCSDAGKNVYNMLSDFSSDASIPSTYSGFLARVLDAGTKEVTDWWKGFRAVVTGELSANNVVGFEGNISIRIIQQVKLTTSYAEGKTHQTSSQETPILVATQAS